jgi:hypothetical protein
MDIESQELITHRRHEFLRWVPVVGVALSFYSVVFATFILYPWHIELSKEFRTLQQNCEYNNKI